MKNSGLSLVFLLASAWTLMAQVKVEVSLDQDQFLPGERLLATIRITNRSGQTLRLGGDPDWIGISVESRDSKVVLRTGDLPQVPAFSLESSKRALVPIDLSPCFNLAAPGRYTVVATLNLKGWNRQFTSEPKPFDIIEGAKYWEQEIGIPPAPGSTNSSPEIRKYILQEANYLRKELVLYLRIVDTNGKLNKVIAIGPMLSFGKPEPQVDKASNLHVLYQNGPHSFSYTVIDPDGITLIRQTYDYTTRPKIQADQDGNLSVIGGRRRLTTSDLPLNPPGVDTNSVSAAPGSQN